MRIIQAQEDGDAEPFSYDERTAARSIVHNTVVTQMKLVVDVALKENSRFSHEETAGVARRLVETATRDIELSSAQTGAMIKQLWADKAVKAIYGERDRLTNVHDGVDYFWDALDRLYKSDYVPTVEDVLRTRLRTSGFEEATFTFKKSSFHVTDLGGQRSERRRWLEALQAASAVIFVSSLCEFDQPLPEDAESTRFAETSSLFTELLENGIQEKFIIVLLNKLDLFKAKMQSSHKDKFAAYFQDYSGPLEWEPCVAYIKRKFEQLSSAHKCRSVSVHAIVAVETDSVMLMWTEIRTMIVGQAIGAALGSI